MNELITKVRTVAVKTILTNVFQGISGGGGGTWGSITGTLSNQTDLQAELDAKENSLTFLSPLVRSLNSISIPAATSLVDGYLTAVDWNTFNGKQSALNGTGFVKISGTTISYDNSTYITGNQTITLSGDISGSGATSITTAIGSGKVTNTMLAGSIDATKINTGAVSNTEFNYLDGVTSAIQTQIDSKLSISTAASTYLTIANPAYTGSITTGTLGYSDTGILAALQSSTNSYNQAIIQNTSNGASASANLNVSNDQATATTNFGEFGINSSGFTGSGAFSQPGNVYVAAATTDLAIGTYGNKSIHFVTNSSATDAMTISGAGAISMPNLSSNGLVTTSGGTGALSVTILGSGVSTWLTTPSWTNFNSAITGTAPYWSLANGGTFTGANTLTGTTTNILKFVFNNLTVTQVDGAGHWLQNPQAATSGNQQISPSTVWEGQGWGTTAGATQTVKVAADVLPVQGSSATGGLRLRLSLNSGAYNDFLAFNRTSAGVNQIKAGLASMLFSINNTNGAVLTLSSSTVSYFSTKLGVGSVTSPTGNLEVGGDISTAAWGTTGIQSAFDANTFTDTGTAGTRATGVAVSIGRPTFASTNAVTVTDAATVYIANDVAQGTGMTLTRTHALWVAAGISRFDGKVQLGSGVSADGAGLKHTRVTTGSISGGSTALVTVTWTTAFADANYTVCVDVIDSTTTSLSLSVVHVESVSASAVTVRVLNNAIGSLTGTLNVIAIHD